MLGAHMTRKSGMRMPVLYAASADGDLRKDWLDRTKVDTFAAEAYQRIGRTRPPNAKPGYAPGSLGGTACGSNSEQVGCEMS